MRSKTEDTSNAFDNLKYGSSVTLNFVGDIDIKLSTKLRISDKIVSMEMPSDEYNINSLFKILPSSNYIMQDKILSIIDDHTDLVNLEIDFENFTSEINSNTNSYNLSLGQSVRFEEPIQLYHESSKRFVSFNPCKTDEISRHFNDQYCDSECFYLGFSEVPSDNTHFSFETVATYQQEEDGFVKKHHYVYLTCFEKGKVHYVYNIGKNSFLTESYKTHMFVNVVNEASSQLAKRNIGKTDVALISFANDNFYLNVPQKIDQATGKY
jgi:hypothetical protein